MGKREFYRHDEHKRPEKSAMRSTRIKTQQSHQQRSDPITDTNFTDNRKCDDDSEKTTNSDYEDNNENSLVILIIFYLIFQNEDEFC